jgi:hypothetical protein
LLDDTDVESDLPVLTTTEATDENEAVISVASGIGTHIPTAKSTRRRRKEKQAAAAVISTVTAAAATPSPPPTAVEPSDTLSLTTHQPGPIGIRWVPHSHSYEGSEERVGSGAKKLLRMRVRRIAPGSVAATWQTAAGLQPGMLLRAVSASAAASSGSDAGQRVKPSIIDLVDSGIGYDKALQMVKSTDRPLTLVFEFQQSRQQATRGTDSALVKSRSVPATSASTSKLRAAPGFGGWDETKAALIAMADHASAAVSQAASSVHSVSVSTPGISGAHSGSERGITTPETHDTPKGMVVELASTVTDAERTGSDRGISDDPQGGDAAGTRSGSIVNVSLVQEGPLGISFEQHPNPRRRHCARIKHLIPGEQAAQRGGMLRPGMVLLRLGHQDMTQLHTYSAAIEFIRSTTKRPVTLSFMLE